MSSDQTNRSGPDFAVFTEYSLSMKAMAPGSNPRVFNTVDVPSSGGIQLDPTTGVITLEPGTYHITATSIVTPYHETDTVAVELSPKPYAGYCFLRYADAPPAGDSGATATPAAPATSTSQGSRAPSGAAKPIATGTISNANMLPSTIETYLRLDAQASILVEHQAGQTPHGLYLQVNANGSTNHVFARICIRRL